MWFATAALCAACLSCSTTRKMARSTIESSVSTTQNDVRKDSSARTVHTDSSRVVVEAERGSVEIIERTEYDTSKPVDSTTGRPPIASETKSQRYTGAREKSVVSSGASSVADVHLAEVDSSRLDTRDDFDEKVDEESEVDAGTGWAWWLIIGAVLAVVIVFAARALYRRYIRPRIL